VLSTRRAKISLQRSCKAQLLPVSSWDLMYRALAEVIQPPIVWTSAVMTAAANYLDHAVTYEADGRGMWSGLGVSKRGLMMAGTVGIECGPSEFDAIEVTLCAA